MEFAIVTCWDCPASFCIVLHCVARSCDHFGLLVLGHNIEMWVFLYVMLLFFCIVFVFPGNHVGSLNSNSTQVNTSHVILSKHKEFYNILHHNQSFFKNCQISIKIIIIFYYY